MKKILTLITVATGMIAILLFGAFPGMAKSADNAKPGSEVTDDAPVKSKHKVVKKSGKKHRKKDAAHTKKIKKKASTEKAPE